MSKALLTAEQMNLFLKLLEYKNIKNGIPEYRLADFKRHFNDKTTSRGAGSPLTKLERWGLVETEKYLGLVWVSVKGKREDARHLTSIDKWGDRHTKEKCDSIPTKDLEKTFTNLLTVRKKRRTDKITNALWHLTHITQTPPKSHVVAMERKGWITTRETHTGGMEYEILRVIKTEEYFKIPKDKITHIGHLGKNQMQVIYDV